MALYAIGDLHLSLGTNKPMDVFGPKWANYVERIRENFSKLNDDDVIVIAGDISWGMSLEQSLPDFQFIDALPGKKILLKGNHDYWWGTASKMKKFFAEHDITTLDILYNNAFFYSDHAICGTRGWFYEEDAAGTHTGKMLAREALRLEASLKAAEGKPIYCFLHYPPVYQGYQCPEMLALLDKYEVERCYYGHLHGYTHRRAATAASRAFFMATIPNGEVRDRGADLKDAQVKKRRLRDPRSASTPDRPARVRTGRPAPPRRRPPASRATISPGRPCR